MPRWLQLVLGLLVLLLLVTGGVLFWRQSLPLPTATLSGASLPLGREPRTLVVHLESPAGKLKTVDVRLFQAGAERLTVSADLSPRDVSSMDWPIEINAP